MKKTRHVRGFTLIELLVVISIIALLIGILLPALAAARRTARQMTNNTQLRGIHQAMVTFAQGNRGLFPGLRSDGTMLLAADNPNHSQNGNLTSARFSILLAGNFFTGEYVINPAETKEAWTSVNVEVTNRNFSYAMLQWGPIANHGRLEEWRETLNTRAPVMYDRNVGTDGADGTFSGGIGDNNLHSVWTREASNEWRGGVVWNDNHVSFETSHRLQETQYSSGPVNENDNIFVTTDHSNPNDTYNAHSIYR